MTTTTSAIVVTCLMRSRFLRSYRMLSKRYDFFFLTLTINIMHTSLMTPIIYFFFCRRSWVTTVETWWKLCPSLPMLTRYSSRLYSLAWLLTSFFLESTSFAAEPLATRCTSSNTVWWTSSLATTTWQPPCAMDHILEVCMGSQYSSPHWSSALFSFLVGKPKDELLTCTWFVSPVFHNLPCFNLVGSLRMSYRSCRWLQVSFFFFLTHRNMPANEM